MKLLRWIGRAILTVYFFIVAIVVLLVFLLLASVFVIKDCLDD